METAKYILIAVVAIYVLYMVYVFQKQISSIRDQVNTSEFLLPMCQTIVELIKDARDTETLLKSLENSKFRNTWVTVYDSKGEVWADGYKPCYGKLPMPPTESQKRAFERLVAEGILEESKHRNGILLNNFEKCELTGHKCAKLSAAMKIPGKDMVLHLQRCG